MRIACSTITWGQSRPPAGGGGDADPYAGRAGYGRMLDEIREAGYAFVTAPGGRRRQRQGAPSPPLPGSLAGARSTRAGPRRLARRSCPPLRRRFWPSWGRMSWDRPRATTAVPPTTTRPTGRRTWRRCAPRPATPARWGWTPSSPGPPPFTPQRRATAGHYPQGNRPDSLQPSPGVDSTSARRSTAWARPAARRGSGWRCTTTPAPAGRPRTSYERLEAGTDPGLVAWGPDVGHMVWGGIDPLPWFRRHMGRVQEHPHQGHARGRPGARAPGAAELRSAVPAGRLRRDRRGLRGLAGPLRLLAQQRLRRRRWWWRPTAPPGPPPGRAPAPAGGTSGTSWASDGRGRRCSGLRRGAPSGRPGRRRRVRPPSTPGAPAGRGAGPRSRCRRASPRAGRG